MNAIVPKLFGAGALFVLVFLTGFWLTRSGQPYAQGIFTLHKLIALAALVLLGALVAGVQRAAPLGAGQWLAVAAAGLCLLGLFATGGVLSALKPAPDFVIRLHHLLPYLAVIAVGAAVTLLVGRGSLLAAGG